MKPLVSCTAVLWILLAASITWAPPSLKAIVLEMAPPDHFFNCPYQNGIFVCWMIDWAGMMSGRLPHSAGPGPYGGFAVNREQAYRQTPYIDFDTSRGYLPTGWWRKWITQNTSAGEERTRPPATAH